MASDASNRETTRDALAALLSTALTGGSNSCQAVFGYKVSEFDKQSPVVVVVSAGSLRNLSGMGTLKFDTLFRFALQVYVADAIAEDSWTDQNVDDRIDLIEKDIADVISDNRSATEWAYLDFEDEFSQIGEIDVSGEPYMMEQIMVVARVFD